MKVHFDRQSHFKLEVKRLVKVFNKHINLWNKASTAGFLSVTKEEISSQLASCYGWDCDRELLEASRNILRYINSRVDEEDVLFKGDLSDVQLKALCVKKAEMVQTIIRGLNCTDLDLIKTLTDELYTQGLISSDYQGASTERPSASQFGHHDLNHAKQALFGTELERSVISYHGTPATMLPVSLELNERCFTEGEGGVWLVNNFSSVELEAALSTHGVEQRNVCTVNLGEDGALSSELLTEDLIYSIVNDYLKGQRQCGYGSDAWADRSILVFSVLLRHSWKIDPSLSTLLKLTALDELIASLESASVESGEEVLALISKLPCMSTDRMTGRLIPSPQSYELWGYCCMMFTELLARMDRVFSSKGGRLLNQPKGQYTILAFSSPKVSTIVKRALLLEMATLKLDTRTSLFVEVDEGDTVDTLLGFTNVTQGRVNIFVGGVTDSGLECLKANSHVIISEH